MHVSVSLLQNHFYKPVTRLTRMLRSIHLRCCLQEDQISTNEYLYPPFVCKVLHDFAELWEENKWSWFLRFELIIVMQREVNKAITNIFSYGTKLRICCASNYG